MSIEPPVEDKIPEPRPSATRARLDAVEEQVESVPGALLSLGRKLLGGQALTLLIAAGAVVFVTLYARESQAQQIRMEVGDALAARDTRILALESARSADASALQYELGKIRSDVAEVRDDQKSQRAETRGIREDLRAMAKGEPLSKLPKDGGP